MSLKQKRYQSRTFPKLELKMNKPVYASKQLAQPEKQKKFWNC